MTKYLIICLFTLFTSGHVLAQDQEKDFPATLTKDASGNLYFEKVFDAPGVTKDELYKRVKLWVTNNLKTVDNNISFDDANKESMATSDAMLLNKIQHEEVPPYLTFKISFAFKEGKYKVNVTQMLFHTTTVLVPFGAYKIGNKLKAKIYDDFDERFTALITSLNTAAQKKDSW